MPADPAVDIAPSSGTLPPPLRHALAGIVGPGRIIDGPAQIARWARATHPARTLPRAVVLTRDAAELAAVMAAAAAWRFAVAPSSQGRNIGLGHRLPPGAPGFAGADWLALDLSAHQAIGALDDRAGTILLEPGVSFASLHAHLRASGARWYMPAIGGPPEASVVANALQRGDGTGPGGDMAASLLAIDALLPGGRQVRLLHGQAGPDMIGLFQQSSLGVVTAAVIGLRPLPAQLTAVRLQLARHALPGAIDALGSCLRDGILAPGACALWNAAKLQARAGVAPADGADWWGLSGALHAASPARAAADWSDFCARLGVGAGGIQLVAHETQAATGLGLLQGEPTRENLGMVSAGLAGEGGEPGFAWLCPALPFTGAAVAELEALCNDVLRPAGLTPNIALGCHDMRTLRGFIALAWDRGDPAMEARALAAHDALFARLNAAGMPPFRLGHLAIDWRPDGAWLADHIQHSLAEAALHAA